MNSVGAVRKNEKGHDQKTARTDIKEIIALHVDIDPRVSESQADARERIIKKLKAYDPVPSVIIASGGGVQGFWFLDKPLPIDGDLDKAEDAKLYNVKLERDLGGDACHNIDRIMRVPGTINVPDAKKVKKGREQAVAELVADSFAKYSLSKFDKAPVEVPVAEPTRGGAGTTSYRVATTVGDGKTAPVHDFDDLRLHKVADYTKMLILNGGDPDDPSKYQSRSEVVLRVICDLIRAEVSDDIIFVIITDPTWKISESILDKRTPHEEARRQIKGAHERIAEDQKRTEDKIDELNERFFVLGDFGGKCRIASFVRERGWRRLSIQSFEDFNHRFPQPVPFGKGFKPLGVVWANSPRRKEYDSVTFEPDGPRVLEGNRLNLWEGFAVEPAQGDWSRMREHIHEILANGDDAAAEYITKWAAWGLQHPGEPAGAVIAFQGGQGTGKGVFLRTWNGLFGQHGLHISSLDQVLGRFNWQLADRCSLFLDEAEMPSAKVIGNFKRLITEPTLTLEPKNKDIISGWPNCLKISMAGNPKQLAPVESDDRRFAVFEVSGRVAKQRSYFTPLYDEINNGGLRAAMLHDLLSMDLGDWSPDPPLQTKAHRTQMALGLSPEATFVERLLQDQSLPGADAKRPFWSPSQVLFSEEFRRSIDQRLIYSSAKSLSLELKKIHAVARPDSKNERRGWWFESPAESRRHWEEQYGPWEWDMPARREWAVVAPEVPF